MDGKRANQRGPYDFHPKLFQQLKAGSFGLFRVSLESEVEEFLELVNLVFGGGRKRKESKDSAHALVHISTL